MTNPSIGRIGEPYFDGKNLRVKGFFTNLHATAAEIEKTLQRVISSKLQTERLTIRVLVSPKVKLSELQSLKVIGNAREFCFEAAIPVKDSAIGWIVYYGSNLLQRRTRAELMQQQLDLLAQTESRRSSARTLPEGFKFRLTNNGGSDYCQGSVDRLVQMYRVGFSAYLVSLDEDCIKQMLVDNMVAAVYHQGLPVASGMAEVAQIDCPEGGRIRIAELSEIVTLKDHQRRGLSHLVVQELIAQLRSDGVDVIFTEARLNHYAIMAVMHDAGLRTCGVLSQHCLISSPFCEVEQEGSFGDLVVMAL